MAVPTITSISPASAAGDGTEIAHVYGTNFSAEVDVYFGEVLAESLGRIVDGGADVALVRVPKFVPAADPNTAVPGVVDVSVQNLDGAGAPIVGESATSIDGFTYISLLDVVKTPGFAGIRGLMGWLLLKLRREVLPNASLGVAVDFSEDGERAIVLADLPALLLSLTRCRPAPFWRRMDRRYRSVDAGPMADVLESISPALAYDCDVTLTLSTDANSKSEVFSLMDATSRFLRANPWIYILDDEKDPAAGGKKWPLVAGAADVILGTGQRPNVITWNLTIRGVQLDEGRALERMRVVDDTIIDVEGLF